MCTCLKDAAAKLEAHLKKSIKMENVYSFDHIGFDNECIMIHPIGRKWSLGNAVGLPFSIEYHPKTKDGSKSKNSRIVKTNLFMTYCPICGKKYPKAN
jgi:hypothetical protein